VSDRSDLLIATDAGLACPRGGFVIDPRLPVELALLTHGHADHARRGSARYVATRTSLPLLHHRLAGAELEGLAYGERRRFGEVIVSMHPAGHMLGSAQIRIEAAVPGRREQEVWVVTGDFKRAADPSCTEFEPLRCDVLICEATFALPIYRWRPPGEVIDEIVAWWRNNAGEARCALLCCYAAGKAQRILVELGRRSDVDLGEIFVHGAIEPGNAAYRASGIPVPAVLGVTGLAKRHDFSKSLVLAPPSALRSVWSRRLGEFEAGFASGWTRLRGYRRRYGFARGFELSDHADWPALLETVRQSGAREVRVTHGYAQEFSRWLAEQGVRSSVLESIAAARAGAEEDAGGEPEEAIE
jgi:putative mRNA 3-end processing factor